MARIPESELILSPDGTVYHLRLRPENLASTVITVGDPQRVSEVSRYFDQVDFKTAHREFTTHTGRIGKKPISVISTGIGTDNIDIVLNELDALVNIDLDLRLVKEQHTKLQIFRLGTCGGLQEDLSPGTLVKTSFGLGLDSLLHFYLYENTPEEKEILDHFIQFTGIRSPAAAPYITGVSAWLDAKFTQGFHSGITLTSPGFYAPQGRSLRGQLAFPYLLGKLPAFLYGNLRIVNFEMETSGIYGLGRVLGHDCLSVSTVVANRITRQFSADIAGDTDKMIRHCLEIIVNC
ncbi:MAG TPA: nucleoside phosphorylase [Chitinophagaceae bacterium]|nr:nucleoside phosphorylase [Chitinophagaceae bacterium]